MIRNAVPDFRARRLEQPGSPERHGCHRRVQRPAPGGGPFWVFANGLSDPSAATVIDGRGEVPLFTDGPFLESKEYIAGMWIIEAPDLDVALKLAAEGSKVCNRKLELRPFHVHGK